MDNMGAIVPADIARMTNINPNRTINPMNILMGLLDGLRLLKINFLPL
jgi:hypothetical protein